MSDHIKIERRIEAPPSVVYAHLTEAEKWIRWQGVGATIDARPGGIFLMEMPNGALARGEFLELVPDRRVVFTWGWVDHPGVPPGSSKVTIDLRDEADATIVTLIHTGLPPDELPLHEAGWSHYLPRLANVVAGIEVGPDPGPG